MYTLTTAIKRFLLFSLLVFTHHFLKAQFITTVAGGSIGDGKPATTVGLNFTAGVATDSANNLYILNSTNYRVRKVDATTGIISTVVGNGSFTASGDGGPATSAGLRLPVAIATDRYANIYIAGRNDIRKVEAQTGIITTICGKTVGGVSGDNIPAINARLTIVTSVATDTAGNVYFTERNRVRKITTATGILTTIAGSDTAGYTGDGGLATAARLTSPKSVTTDDAGNVYVADNGNNVIRKITAATGIITTVAGTGVSGNTGDGGPATAAQLAYSYAIAADGAGNLYLSDNNRIRKVDAANGIINAFIGTGMPGYSGDGGPALLAAFYNAGVLCINPAGNISIVDRNNYLIRQVTAASFIINTVAGNRSYATSGIGGPAADAQLNSPGSIASDKWNNIYLTDYSNGKLYRINAATDTIETVAGTGSQGLSLQGGIPATTANFSSPRGVTVDTAGNFYFTANSTTVRKVDIATGLIYTIAGNGTYSYSGDGGAATAAALNDPFELTFDAAGNLYIADKGNHDISKVAASTGIITTIAGTGTAGYTGDGGAATAAKLNSPFGVAVDRWNNIYIADNANNVIRRVDGATGIITTVAGTGIAGYTGDGGLATAASISYPFGLTTDTAGNVYIASQFNQAIRKIDIATGIITSIAGTGNSGYNGDGIAPTVALLNNPTDLCFDTAGNLLIADNANDRIRKIVYDTTGTDTTQARLFVNAVATVANDGLTVNTVLYPNPAHAAATLVLKGAVNGATSIVVTNIQGKEMWRYHAGVQNTSQFTTTLPLQQFSKGLYFVTVYINQSRYIHKLLVQ